MIKKLRVFFYELLPPAATGGKQKTTRRYDLGIKAKYLFGEISYWIYRQYTFQK